MATLCLWRTFRSGRKPVCLNFTSGFGTKLSHFRQHFSFQHIFHQGESLDGKDTKWRHLWLYVSHHLHFHYFSTDAAHKKQLHQISSNCIKAQASSYLFSRRENGPTGPKPSTVTLLLHQTQSKCELINALKHVCVSTVWLIMDGLKIWRYYFPSFLETNWTFIAYILKIIQSWREADVSFIEAHREVRSHWINFPVLLLPQEDVWKMPATLNWFRNEFITWGV